MLRQFAVYVKHTRTNTQLIPLPIVNSACLHQHRTKFGKSQSVCTSTIPLPSISPELYTQHHGKANLPKLNRWCQHRLYCGQCGNQGNGGKRNLNWVAPACQLSKAAHAADAPPCAHASMSAIPSTFSRRCCCVCAELSGMAQSSF